MIFLQTTLPAGQTDMLFKTFGISAVIIIMIWLLGRFLEDRVKEQQKTIHEKDNELIKAKEEQISSLRVLLEDERKTNKENNEYIRELNSQSLETLSGISSFLNTLIEKVDESKGTMKETVEREAKSTRDTIHQMREIIEQRTKKE